MCEPAFKRGQVWHYNPSYEVTGHIQKFARPVIIISNDVQNRVSPVIIGISCTTQNKNYSPANVEFVMKGIHNTAIGSQPFPINKFDLTEYICELPNDVMEQVNKAVAVAVGLTEAYQPRSISEAAQSVNTSSAIDKFYSRYPKLAPQADTKKEEPKTKRKHKWSEELKETFLDDCGSKSCEEVAALYGISEKSVTAYFRKFGG